MNMYHYSDKPEIFESSRTYNQIPGTKPFGFWISTGETDTNSWPSWNKKQYEPISDCSDRQLVDFDTTGILKLSTLEDIQAFKKVYGSAHHLPSEYKPFLELFTGKPIGIDWSLVCQKYKGILISDYNREYLNDNRVGIWYDMWDCNGGCIWDLSVITSVTKEDV